MLSLVLVLPLASAAVLAAFELPFTVVAATGAFAEAVRFVPWRGLTGRLGARAGCPVGDT